MVARPAHTTQVTRFPSPATVATWSRTPRRRPHWHGLGADRPSRSDHRCRGDTRGQRRQLAQGPGDGSVHLHRHRIGGRVCPATQTLNNGADQSVSGTTTDAFGNSASVTISNIDVDGTLPTITGAPTTAPAGAGWYSGDVTVHFVCGDTGVGRRRLSDDAAVTGEGDSLTVTRSVTDKVGKRRRPPCRSRSTARAGRERHLPGGQRQRLVQQRRHRHVRVRGHALRCRQLRCADSQPRARAPACSSPATRTDNVGRTGSATFGPFSVDKTKPTITGAATTSPNAAGWYSGRSPCTSRATDALSGIPTVVPGRRRAHRRGREPVGHPHGDRRAGNTKVGNSVGYQHRYVGARRDHQRRDPELVEGRSRRRRLGHDHRRRSRAPTQSA